MYSSQHEKLFKLTASRNWKLLYLIFRKTVLGTFLFEIIEWLFFSNPKNNVKWFETSTQYSREHLSLLQFCLPKGFVTTTPPHPFTPPPQDLLVNMQQWFLIMRMNYSFGIKVQFGMHGMLLERWHPFVIASLLCWGHGGFSLNSHQYIDILNPFVNHTHVTGRKVYYFFMHMNPSDFICMNICIIRYCRFLRIKEL